MNKLLIRQIKIEHEEYFHEYKSVSILNTIKLKTFIKLKANQSES